MQTTATATVTLLGDHEVLDILRRLDNPTNRHSELFPIDNYVMSYLVRRRAIDHEIYDSEQTIARALGYKDRETIAASLVRLEKVGWITVRHRGNWNTLAIQINFDRLPACASVRDKISKEAGLLALWYKGKLERNGIRKFHKNWLKRSEPSAQNILTRLEGKVGSAIELAKYILAFGFEQPHWKRLLMRGSLYHVEKCFNKILRECEFWRQSQAKKQATDAQRMNGGMENADRNGAN